MRFQVDHDWQGNMATPRAKVGENTKTQLLLVLCAIWVLIGLIGHAPWKPLETTAISIVKNLLNGASLIAPLATGANNLDAPPLYYWTAAASAKLLSPILNMHDGARLINALWMSIILLMVGMTGRELWTRGVGRYATFIMIGTIGLVINAHSLNAEVASLASGATGFYALALANRRPWRASALMGLAIAVGFLADGFTIPLILLGTSLMLMGLFRAWRSVRFLTFLSTAILIAAPLIAIWLTAFYLHDAPLFAAWLNKSLTLLKENNSTYFARILVWFAWPALPQALWSLWRYRAQLLVKPKFQLAIVFFIIALVVLGMSASDKDINALPLLLPLVALGAGSVEHLKRGAAAALNWFGIALFGMMGALVWLGWFGMITGYPAKIKERMQFLSGSDFTQIQWLSLVIALLMTAIWAFASLRLKQTNRSAVTNWAVGMTFVWTLLMTLWLPWLDSAKSYQSTFSSLHQVIPKHANCVYGLNVGESQRLLLAYYTDIQLQPMKSKNVTACDFYLIQDERGTPKMQPGFEWQLVWKKKRPADRKEAFRLFKRLH